MWLEVLVNECWPASPGLRPDLRQLFGCKVMITFRNVNRQKSRKCLACHNNVVLEDKKAIEVLLAKTAHFGRVCVWVQ